MLLGGGQARNTQLQENSGERATIDRISGVFYSDLTGPMSPQDRLGNRYLINFVDHKSNYRKVLLARTKQSAEKQSEAF